MNPMVSQQFGAKTHKQTNKQASTPPKQQAKQANKPNKQSIKQAK